MYTETNQPRNQVVVFARRADGSITEVQRVDTGGAGSLHNQPFGQDFLDSNNAVELTDDGQLLFVVNAGDNTISSFQVGRKGGLRLVDRKPSGGIHPTSVDTRGSGNGDDDRSGNRQQSDGNNSDGPHSERSLLYVFNVDSNDISGLRYARNGTMTPIPNSTRQLATPASTNQFGQPVPFADQVIFSPNGRVLVVPERLSNGFQGQLDTFALGSDGRPGPAHANASNAFIPFALAWDNNRHLIVANGGPPPNFSPGSGSSYSLSGTTLTPIDNESANADATCWLAVTNNGKYAFMVNQNTKDVSRFAISRQGNLTLLGKVPTSGLGADTALSGDSRYLYVQNVLNANGAHGATIDSYRVGSGGSLVHLGVTDSGVPDSASGLAAR